jgi:spore maturation protein CgeB
MIARVIRKLSNTFYDYPLAPSAAALGGPFKHLKMALVTDFFTTDCLSVECQIKCLTRQNYRDVICNWKPDLVFVESVFHGVGGNWRYEIAMQPRYLRWSKPTAIYALIAFAKEHGIPVVFWNKDDGAYFEDFIELAVQCDYVFTTDANCIPRYRARLPADTPAEVLMMPYQPAFHSFQGFHFSRMEACFVGSYYRRILNERRAFLDLVFEAAGKVNLPIQIYDRNHGRLSHRFAFGFPKLPHLHIHPSVAQRQTASLYQDHVISLNVNSVTNSETMVSRRLLEILACGGIVVSNPSLAIQTHFLDFCHVAHSSEELQTLFERLQAGPNADDLERARAGAEYVAAHHTWTHRLEQICQTLGL